MKVFLSWHGELSKAVANALHDWIPYIIQSAKPFVSTGDIQKGKRWSGVLGNELAKSKYGIICVTKGNLKSPWLHFEAGALSKAVDKSCVSPFLFNLDPTQVQGPLEQFEATIYTEDGADVLNLMQSINDSLPSDDRVPLEVLREEFKKWWPTLRAKLRRITQIPDNESHILYTIDDLVRMHQGRDCKALWWITPNPYTYALKEPSRDLIKKGLEKGINFTFVFPLSNDLANAKHDLNQLAAAKPQVIEVTDQKFRSSAVTDYLIGDPETNSMQMYLELPSTQRGWWTEVDPQAAGGFVLRFKELVSGEVVTT